MCGILMVFKKNEQIDKENFNSALSLLKHRGPDEQHYTILNNPNIAFGHTRLSIIGVDNGEQPLKHNNDLTAIVNGEFYDYKQIRQNYKSKGYKFNTNTDSEIILPMYLENGNNCFAKLNGEFAGVIYDKNKQQIIAFRDRHGVKPLYFSIDNKGISFASEIKSILKYNKQKAEFNIRELKDRLYGQPLSQGDTIFKNIYNVKPSHFMVYDIRSGNISEHRYWQPKYERSNYTSESLTEILDQYRTRITKAIERRLVSDVPVATYLSGGIDSSVCYAIASQLSGKGLDAFTISFDDKDYDESLIAKKLINKYSGKQNTLYINDQILADNLTDHLWCLENTTFNPHGVAKHLLSKLVRENNYKVVLTGEGSDEYNCGYITNVIDAMQVNPEMFDKNSIASKIEVNKGVFLADGARDIDYLKRKLGFSPSFCSNHVPQVELVNNLFSTDFKDENCLGKFQRFLDKNFIDTSNWDALNISLYYQSLNTFAYVLTALGDRTEMAHSVEARVPFLDNDVIDYITKVPPKYKYYNNTDKFILRESCKDFVTPEHYQNMKHPYMAPPSKAKSPLNIMMGDIFHSNNFIPTELFDHGKLLELFNIHIKNGATDPFISRILFNIFSAAMLNDIFDFS
ncbi:asparagine synthase (glutamine-hydrolyzing) [Francisella sp. 19X1-34]|uniref:asparagine synthase (glutamine-hydrolyzing) n=1 Tax=Francisella sp. 19X1-34 TaxID=3087177 RepID=UPI002E2FFB79|nr:asparagine synthase (glutamine-hydrolyzing) [Francisella sp. 19X1-34]MED7789526.1 asparagine synthase (glutamine-hydrolyzing) [Francisella sp. 19X1-34]